MAKYLVINKDTGKRKTLNYASRQSLFKLGLRKPDFVPGEYVVTGDDGLDVTFKKA